MRSHAQRVVETAVRRERGARIGRASSRRRSSFSTDLHSLGQYIQDGTRNLFETVISIENNPVSFPIPNDPANIDGLNFLSGMDLNTVKKTAMQATLPAHNDGGVPNLLLELSDRSERTLGQLIYFLNWRVRFPGTCWGSTPSISPA